MSINDKIKSSSRKLALAVGAVVAGAGDLLAQPTNTPAGIAHTINTPISAAYDTAITISVAVMAIGAVIFFVRKGLKARM